MKKISTLVAATSIAMASSAYAFSVNQLILYITPDNNVQDLTLNNDTSSTTYIQVTPQLVTNPGNTPEQLQTYKAGDNPQNFGLMITPLKLAIQGNSQRNVRVVSLSGNPKVDKLYYLNIAPVQAPTASTDSDQSNINMKVGVGYIVKVVVLPADPKPVVSAVRNGNSVTIKNTGNSYISLRNGQLCNTSGENCKPLPDGQNYHALFAGNTWTFQTTAPGIVKYTGIYAGGDKSTSVSSN